MIERYRPADAAVVVDEFLQGRWPGYRAALDRALPGAFAQAVTDATSSKHQATEFLGWHFGEVQARRISQPVLSVLGGGSHTHSPRFGETHRLLLAWLPHAEGFILPGATHFLQLEDPPRMADVLADFWARHPLPGGDMPCGSIAVSP